MLSSYPSGTPIVGSDGFPIDFKADSDLQQALNFHLRGQTAYGKWFKRLGSKDRPPRGACAKFFEDRMRSRLDSRAQDI